MHTYYLKNLKNVKSPKKKIKATKNNCYLIISLNLNFGDLPWTLKL